MAAKIGLIGLNTFLSYNFNKKEASNLLSRETMYLSDNYIFSCFTYV